MCVQVREKADKYWCTRALRSKTVCERVYVITCLLTATYTKQNIANGLVKKLLAIQSNLKQFCLLVIPLGSLENRSNYLIVSFLLLLRCKDR